MFRADVTSLLHVTGNTIDLELPANAPNPSHNLHQPLLHPKYVNPPFYQSPSNNLGTSEFVAGHLSSNDMLLHDPSFHSLEVSPDQFRSLSITFYPGFAERNAFLGHFKSTTKKRDRQQSTDRIIRLLSQIPVGSRLRYINHSDCHNMPYSKIMNLLANELAHCPSTITLQFEDVTVIQQKVQNSSGAVMAWHVKQQTLGVHADRNTTTLKGHIEAHEYCGCGPYWKSLCDCGHVTHSCVRDVVDSWYMTLLVFVVIIYDLSIVFYAESHRIFWEHHDFASGSSVHEEETVVALTLLALSLYLIEIAFRVYGYGNHFTGTPVHLLQSNYSNRLHHHRFNHRHRLHGHLAQSHELDTESIASTMSPNNKHNEQYRATKPLSLSSFDSAHNASLFEHKNGGINFNPNFHRRVHPKHWHQSASYNRRPSRCCCHCCHCCSACRYVTGYLARGWIEFFDSLIIIISFIITVADIAFIRRFGGVDGVEHTRHSVVGISIPISVLDALPAIYELLRLIRITLRIVCKLKYTPKCIRLLVSVNRQRYFDANFDLDLCYIIYPRYLVMSWPGSGVESLYRNPLREVAKFLNKYHAENYLIFDLCKERSYDDMLFNGRVMRSRAMIDHSVCSLSDMFEFAQLVHLWLRHDPVHCAVKSLAPCFDVIFEKKLRTVLYSSFSTLTTCPLLHR